MTVTPSSSINFVAVCLCLISAAGNKLASRHDFALLLCAVDHLNTLLLLLLFHIVHMFLLLLLLLLLLFVINVLHICIIIAVELMNLITVCPYLYWCDKSRLERWIVTQLVILIIMFYVCFDTDSHESKQLLYCLKI